MNHANYEGRAVSVSALEHLRSFYPCPTKNSAQPPVDPQHAVREQRDTRAVTDGMLMGGTEECSQDIESENNQRDTHQALRPPIGGRRQGNSEGYCSRTQYPYRCGVPRYVEQSVAHGIAWLGLHAADVGDRCDVVVVESVAKTQNRG